MRLRLDRTVARRFDGELRATAVVDGQIASLQPVAGRRGTRVHCYAASGRRRATGSAASSPSPSSSTARRRPASPRSSRCGRRGRVTPAARRCAAETDQPVVVIVVQMATTVNPTGAPPAFPTRTVQALFAPSG